MQKSAIKCSYWQLNGADESNEATTMDKSDKNKDLTRNNLLLFHKG
jgi:hypothetical protein